MNTPPVSDTALLRGPALAHHPLDELLRTSACAWPDRTAVIHRTGELSYAELHARADAIASGLHAQGIETGDRVGVLLQRNDLLVPSLLGILKAGAAYVPLDASYPPQRLQSMLMHAQVNCLLVSPELRGSLTASGGGGWRETDPATLLELNADTDASLVVPDASPAYLIYTSGTTGKPKGVSISRAALANLLVALQRVPGLDCSDRVLGLSTIAFDIHVLELLAPLVQGATIVLADDTQVTEPAALLELIERTKITLIQATPSMWGVLLSAGLPPLPNTSGVAGGERLAPAMAQQLARQLRHCWNMYGPTEAAVYTTAKLLGPGEKVSIGSPLANLWVAVARQGTQFGATNPRSLATIGEPGELIIGGAGLAEGYWQNPQATAEQFGELVLDGQTVRTYSTGDLAFIDKDGDVHCQGRQDQQIKLRGHRIELSEIEHALLRHPQLTEAACSVHRYAQNDDRLVAYHTNGALQESDLREFVANQLPPYMIPQRFLCLAQLPRLASGKLDRSALPRPQPAVDRAEQAAGPGDSRERRALAACWQRLLGVTPADAHNFMDQGGHSLLALQLVQEIAEGTGKELPVRLVVLEDFAALIAHLEAVAPVVSIGKGGILAGFKKHLQRLFTRS